MTMDRIEVITSVERRRQWSAADKVRLVAAMDEPGAVVTEIARSAGVNASLLYRWRRDLRGARTTPMFVPVRVAPARRATRVRRAWTAARRRRRHRWRRRRRGPRSRSRSGANLRQFGVKSASLAVAVGEANSEAVLYVPSENTGGASLTENWGDRPWARSMTVPVRTAQWIVDQTGFGWPTLVKIDVEGSEVTVFRSLLPAFQSGRVRCCVFEASPSAADFAQILAMTAPFGYEAFAIRRSLFFHLARAHDSVYGTRVGLRLGKGKGPVKAIRDFLSAAANAEHRLLNPREPVLL